MSGAHRVKSTARIEDATIIVNYMGFQYPTRRWRSQKRSTSGGNKAQPLSPDSDYRADIDGLRAVAITLVVLYHLQANLVPGGFVGVDVFFVISGFLITRLIVHGLEQKRFSLIGFYERRIRRIFPALIVVLATVWLIGWYRLLPQDFNELGRQILAGSAFSSNLLNYSEAGYFDQPETAKPLLHLWSLGVEEQFYLAMPLLLIFAFRRGLSVAWCLGLIAALSFAGSIVVVQYSQPAAFYLPFTRFWELAIGGFLAYAVTHYSAVTERFQRHWVSIVGIALIVAAAYLSPTSTFPGWWATLPVLGSALIIAAGPGAAINQVLSSGPGVALGLISYPLYLWHWPLLVLLQRPGSKGRWLVVLAIVLAAGTYLLVERPLRSLKLSRTAFASLAGMAGMALVAGAVVVADGVPGRYSPPIPDVFLRVPRPNYFPAHYEAGNIAGPKVLLWGDSHADHLFPGFLARRAVQPLRLYHESFAADCAPIRAQAESRRCIGLLTAIEHEVEILHPDIVVISALWTQYSPFNIEGLNNVLKSAGRAGAKHIFVIGPEPRWPQPLPEELANVYLKAPQNGVPVRLNDYVRTDPELEQSIVLAATGSNANYVSAMKALCNAEGCVARVGHGPGDIIQFDTNHFSEAGSKYFVNLIAAQIIGSREDDLRPQQ